jgi:hypothetical protein
VDALVADITVVIGTTAAAAPRRAALQHVTPAAAVAATPVAALAALSRQVAQAQKLRLPLRPRLHRPPTQRHRHAKRCLHV